MKQDIALCILSLNEAAQISSHAEDRPVYDRFLASAAMLLALVEVNSDDNTIHTAIHEHERQWGHNWLLDMCINTPGRHGK